MYCGAGGDLEDVGVGAVVEGSRDVAADVGGGDVRDGGVEVNGAPFADIGKLGLGSPVGNELGEAVCGGSAG